MRVTLILVIFVFISCKQSIKIEKEHPNPITGTWELISATTIQGDSIFNKDLKDKKMIKMINDSHFAFLNHDINKEKDSLKYYTSGGGKYKLSGNKYVEYLEYCSARGWEGHKFEFTMKVKGDTLVQRGVEIIEKLGVEREIIEVYLKSKE